MSSTFTLIYILPFYLFSTRSVVVPVLVYSSFCLQFLFICYLRWLVARTLRSRFYVLPRLRLHHILRSAFTRFPRFRFGCRLFVPTRFAFTLVATFTFCLLPFPLPVVFPPHALLVLRSRLVYTHTFYPRSPVHTHHTHFTRSFGYVTAFPFPFLPHTFTHFTFTVPGCCPFTCTFTAPHATLHGTFVAHPFRFTFPFHFHILPRYVPFPFHVCPHAGCHARTHTALCTPRLRWLSVRWLRTAHAPFPLLPAGSHTPFCTFGYSSVTRFFSRFAHVWFVPTFFPHTTFARLVHTFGSTFLYLRSRSFCVHVPVYVPAHFTHGCFTLLLVPSSHHTYPQFPFVHFYFTFYLRSVPTFCYVTFAFTRSRVRFAFYVYTFCPTHFTVPRYPHPLHTHGYTHTISLPVTRLRLVRFCVLVHTTTRYVPTVRAAFYARLHVHTRSRSPRFILFSFGYTVPFHFTFLHTLRSHLYTFAVYVPTVPGFCSHTTFHVHVCSRLPVAFTRSPPVVHTFTFPLRLRLVILVPTVATFTFVPTPRLF